MISRQEHNELVRKVRRDRWKHLRDKYHPSGAKIYDPYDGTRHTITGEEIEHIRRVLEIRRRKSRRRTLIVFSGAAILFGFLCYKILISLSYL